MTELLPDWLAGPGQAQLVQVLRHMWASPARRQRLAREQELSSNMVRA